LAARSRLTIKRDLSRSKRFLVQTTEASREADMAALLANPDVESVSLNYIYQISVAPDDPQYPLQWGLPKINAETAWNTTTGDPSIKVAVIDNGFQLDHPDLTGRFVEAYNTWTGDATGMAPNCPHGTNVSSVIGATANNAAGVAGLNWQSKIAPSMLVLLAIAYR